MKRLKFTFHFVALFVLMLSMVPAYGQDEAAAEPAPATEQVVAAGPAVETPLHEKFGMTDLELFIWMISITLLLLIAVLVLSGTLKAVVHRYGKEFHKGAKMIAIGFLVLSPAVSLAATEYPSYDKLIVMTDFTFWMFVAIDSILVALIFHYLSMIQAFLPAHAKAKRWFNWKKVSKDMTDLVPIEEEASILLDHDYDGIKELDNNLPPWWKYGFYITIVWAVGYFFYFQVFEVGALQEKEFQIEMEEGEREVAAYKAAHPELITAESVELLTDKSSLAAGRSIFETNCVACHMEGGAGGTGPNLTDKYWIYDGDIKGVFNTISEGAENGMRAWKSDLNGIEIQKVASYILSLEEILPPTGKEPQGENIVQ